MKWSDLLPKIKKLLSLEDSPDFLMIHCGGNSIGNKFKKSCKLGHDMTNTIDCLKLLIPNTKLIWSEILPRLQYRNENSHKALDTVRIRLNNKLATYVLEKGGFYIRYPELSELDSALFKDLPDGVHLTDFGNSLFLYRIQQALHNFLLSNVKVSPPNGELGPWLHIGGK